MITDNPYSELLCFNKIPLLFLSLSFCIILSCSKRPNDSVQYIQLFGATDTNPDSLTAEQQSAFDALNTLQVSTDQKNRLYSTFPNITQPCYPPDTSFVITQEELLEAMQKFLVLHAKSFSPERRKELATTAVLAQQAYKVNFCPEDPEDISYKKGIPLSGTWVLPGILGRRDLSLVW